MNIQVLIIGGGLSGVTVAHQLTKKGIDNVLIEAKDILGGRILSPHTDAESTKKIAPAIDLGPSWFWPDQQHIAALIAGANLSNAIFEQTSSGNSVIEYSNGTIEQTLGSASMAGSLRISGGMVNLVNQLAATLPSDSVLCNTVAQSIALTDQGVLITAANDERTVEFNSRHVVLALPPRVVAETIDLQPVITSDYLEKLRSVSTWMASEAKFVATYAKPFWRQMGFSGDGMSQIGPLAEVHDASPDSEGPYALFGFVGVPSSQRENNETLITQCAVEQLSRMFGIAGADPIDVYFKDWAFDPYSSTEVDRRSHRAHPNSRGINTTEWQGRLVWAGSEMAGTCCPYSGYLEGAVVSANKAVALLKL